MNSKWIPFLFIFAILGMVLVIVLRDDKSFVTKFAQMISRNVEGFASQPPLDNPKCPPGGYNFFNDRRGESFCCRGRINPYTHMCDAGGGMDLCAFRPNMPDPRNRHRMLPLCSSMIKKDHSTQQASCPGSLPNYASIGKCCLENPDMDGYNCMPVDNRDFKRYCKLQGPLAPGEQLCSDLKMMAAATCPKEIPQVFWYKTGKREAAAYGAGAENLNVPVCMGMDNICIPDMAIDYYKTNNGLYKDKNTSTWAYSCSGWSTANVAKDTTIKMDKSYLPRGARRQMNRRQF
jgi:hypothetical protein